MSVIDKIHMLKKILKEADNIVAWQEDIYTALHNIDASWVVSGIFPVVRGGTGLSTIALGGILYASALDTLSRLAPTASNQVLRSTAANALQFAALFAADIPNLDASKITSGVFVLARIPNMDWAHISGLFPRTIADLLSDHDLAHHPLAIIPVMDDGHIPDLETLSYGGPFAVAQIPGLPASQITSGQFPLSRMPRAASGLFLEGNGVGAAPIFNALVAGDIPNLDASKITSGAFALARIPNMDWAHISGLFPRTIAQLLSDHNLANHPLAIIPVMDDGHIPNLETLSYGGAFAVAQIPNLPASKITSGRFPMTRMPDMGLNKIMVGQGAGNSPVEQDKPVGAPSGLIAMWHGTIANIPSGWVICDGNNSTPNLLAKFIEGVATAATNPGATGGATAKTTAGHQHELGVHHSGNVIYFDFNEFGTGANFDTVSRLDGAASVVSVATSKSKSNTDTITDIRPLFYDVAFIMKT